MKPILTAFLLLSAFLSGAQTAPDWNPTPTPSSGSLIAKANLIALLGDFGLACQDLNN